MHLGQTPNRRPLLALPLLALAALCVQPVVAQSEDACLPEEFSVTTASYFPFDPDVVVDLRWFSLQAERERVDTFPSDTEYVGFIDAYDLGFRYVLLGTHENRQVASIDSCLLQALPNPVQETICFVEGASRRESLSVGYAPLDRRTLEATVNGQSLTEVDVLSAEIGSISVPVRVIERIPGRAFFLLELWDFRFEVGVADLAILRRATAHRRRAAPRRTRTPRGSVESRANAAGIRCAACPPPGDRSAPRIARGAVRSSGLEVFGDRAVSVRAGAAAVQRRAALEVAPASSPASAGAGASATAATPGS
ncbi:MAG: hypothetical protein AAGF23_16215 [Acidobacteriota bacterium]